ncbi:hypothetical protein EIP91_011848 [Steccherinum ochraceum]|uniref:Uncharacterized protein n=1 Tax=Steccherinum ochraceum TaxID=92696 RepID=A0A4R0RXY6_9APHY|nr:hypothetical protein EIP91_011848 [Steccherinum ochraceum]
MSYFVEADSPPECSPTKDASNTQLRSEPPSIIIPIPIAPMAAGGTFPLHTAYTQAGRWTPPRRSVVETSFFLRIFVPSSRSNGSVTYGLGMDVASFLSLCRFGLRGRVVVRTMASSPSSKRPPPLTAASGRNPPLYATTTIQREIEHTSSSLPSPPSFFEPARSSTPTADDDWLEKQSQKPHSDTQ